MTYYIEYKNEKLPVYISHYAMKMLWKETSKSVDDVLQDNAGFNELTEVFLYYCLEAGHKKEKKVFELEKDEMQWILDDNFLKFQNIIRENFIREAIEAGLNENSLDELDIKEEPIKKKK